MIGSNGEDFYDSIGMNYKMDDSLSRKLFPDFHENAYIIKDSNLDNVPENQKPMPIHTLIISNEDFKKNSAIDLSEYVKQLQNNDYIPWGVALHYLREYNPNLAVGFETNEAGHPYFFDSERGGYFLAYIYDKSSGGTTPSIFFPIRNNKRQANADAMMDTIGNQMQRAIAKVIAQEVGIGWSLYSRIDESMLELEESDKPQTSAGVKNKITPKNPGYTPSYSAKQTQDNGFADF